MTRNGVPVNIYRTHGVENTQQELTLGPSISVPKVGIGPRITLHLALRDVLKFRGIFSVGSNVIGIARGYDLKIHPDPKRKANVPGIDEQLLELLESPVKRMPNDLRTHLRGFLLAYRQLILKSRTAQSTSNLDSPIHISEQTPLVMLEGYLRRRFPAKINSPFAGLHVDGEDVIRHTDGMDVEELDNGTIAFETDHSVAINNEDRPSFVFLRTRQSPRLANKVYRPADDETLFFAGKTGIHGPPSPKGRSVHRQLISGSFDYNR